MKIKKQDMTQDILKEYFNYDAYSGFVTWKKKSGQKPIIGNRAGSIATVHKHRVIHFKGCVWAEHRLIWLWIYGKLPVKHLDHINHNETDNRLANLREVSQLENNCNNSIRKDNSSGHVGVWINPANSKKKFMAEISYKNIRYIKSFYSLEEAIITRKNWEKELGFHCNHGIPKS